ncbi:MAG: 16S rRNA (guanine(527)-N(7))-methyltransferase RsmG [Proteobacteria bacterium]|nr:MAG: 16S rRNA (guanine(527)-N(7))-methyltransferase RsmG [Pseudomonadota bacterium]PIE68112.1 MAG: 16S rRNA (guanine(527)-N(7))-methyltransferase RsmG [Deltaproteobacteria bacterium]
MNVNSEQWHRTVIEGARALGVDVSLDQARTMGLHAAELLLWNRSVNLTAITEPLAVAVKHYVDSLAALSLLGEAKRVLDAGSGGGFPGIPLKISRPGLSLTMVDSVRKKISFLKHAVRTLGLREVDAVHGRLEAMGRHPDYCGRFDLVICRAFASLDDFAARTVAFLAPGGCLIALKGPQPDPCEEADAGTGEKRVIQLGGASFSIQVHRYTLPTLDSQRRLVRLTPLAGEGVYKS